MILLTIIGIWMSVEGHRRLGQVFPDPVQKLWNKYELRGVVLISLVSQIILTVLGNRKKFKPNIWRRPLVWAAYMIADWVATFALGVITSTLGDYDKSSGEQKDMNPQLIAFWAPFFLVHLGGPDTITAYSLEDNELWLRHLVGLVAQTGVTIYIILLSWNNTSWLSCLSIPMLVVGFIKYGERILSLYSASTEHLRDSLHSWASEISHRQYNDEKLIISEFMGDFVSLFVDLILPPGDILERRQLLGGAVARHISSHQCDVDDFEAVGYQLGAMYDVFYTKAFAMYNGWGSILRLIISLATVVVLILYITFNENNKEYLVLDHVITYLLLIEAAISEIYALILLFPSIWMEIRLGENYTFGNPCGKIFEGLCMPCRPLWESKLSSFGQTNLLTKICNERNKFSGNSFLKGKFQDVPSIRHQEISSDLQLMILSYYSGMSRSGYCHHVRSRLKVPMASNLEFHRAIITWHIVTDLCYYHDEDLSSISRNESKTLSDYMFYLLVKCRHMLPVGAGLVTLEATYVEAKKLFPKNDIRQACCDLLQCNTITPINELVKTGSRSVFSYACTIARGLLTEDPRDRENMWNLLAELWIEILSYASAQCRVDNHAKQLRRGVEFLSHVWLLQARFGLLEEYQGIMDEEEKRVVACRESGHIVASWFLEDAGSLQEVTILPKNTPESLTSRYFPTEHLSMTGEQLLVKSCIALGGKVAMEVFQEKDEEVSNTMRERDWLVDEYEDLMYALNKHIFHDRNLRNVNDFVLKARDDTVKLIKQRKEKVAQIAELLFEKEVIYKEDLVKILGERSFSPDQPTNYEGSQGNKEGKEIREVGTSSCA